MRAFHKAFGHPAPDKIPAETPENDLVQLREQLNIEECCEIVHALTGKTVDLKELADGLCDLIYVAAGALVAAGHKDATLEDLPELDPNPPLSNVNWWFAQWLMSAVRIANESMRNKFMGSWGLDLSRVIHRCEVIAKFYHIPLRECFEEVQRSNMSKLGADGKPILETSGPKKGKVVKGPNFKPPEIEAILKRHKLL